ncbi:MAG: hypothetical protein R3Y22_06620 [Bacteroidales bacterium]
METEEIQKEFETLVSELEKLKSVNELTSTNAESANKLVKQVDIFVRSIEQFKFVIDEDYKKKSNDLGDILERLDDVILSVNSNTKKNIDDHTNTLKELHDKSDSIMNQNYIVFNKEVNTLDSKLSEFKDTVLSKISDILSELKCSVLSKISDSTDEIKTKNNQIQKDINNVSNQINLSTSTINTNLDSTSDILSDIKYSILSYIEDNRNEIIEQNEKLRKQNLITFAIILFSIVAVLSTILLIK